MYWDIVAYSLSSNDEGRCPGMGGGILSPMLAVVMGEGDVNRRFSVPLAIGR